MRWNPFRPGAKPDGGTADAGSRARPETDKLTMAIRQRRMFTAQLRVDQLLGFSKRDRRWCDYPTAEELDSRRTDLGPATAQQQWPDVAALDAALRAAAPHFAGQSGFAHVLDEPEARWLEAALDDLLVTTAGALDRLGAGVVFLSGDGGLLLEVRIDGDGRRSHRTAAHGRWPLPSP